MYQMAQIFMWETCHLGVWITQSTGLKEVRLR
jgi:hypothetical protein